MPRIRKKTIKNVHIIFGDAAQNWNSYMEETLHRYSFQHGVAHLISCQRLLNAEKLLTDFAYNIARLQSEQGSGARPLAKDFHVIFKIGTLHNSNGCVRTDIPYSGQKRGSFFSKKCTRPT